MVNNTGAVISLIKPGSIADQLDLTTGDKIISINGENLSDLIDYRFLCADDFLEIELERENGEIWVLEIEKEPDEDLGISFEHAVFDSVRSCHNKCVFCFVDQMPPAMRKTLYVKDDDYRLSFLQGNFITLTNMSEADIDRIIRLRLSPLYVSVHAVDDDIRNDALSNPNAAKSLQILARLVEAGIQVHTQIVLVPGLNDGQALENTVTKLGKMYPHVISLAVVPVGLTRFRENLRKLRLFSPLEAVKVLDYVEAIQKDFLTKHNTRFIFASDEFYLLAGRSMPDYDQYEDFCQLENGVGLTRLFWHQVAVWLEEKRTDEDLISELTGDFVLVTGKSGRKVLQPIVDQAKTISKLNIQLVEVENNWFGSQITVTGLLTATDILKELETRDLAGRKVLIPDIVLRQNEAVFLDDMRLAEFQQLIKAPVAIVETTGRGLMDALFNEASQGSNRKEVNKWQNQL